MTAADVYALVERPLGLYMASASSPRRTQEELSNEILEAQERARDRATARPRGRRK